MSLRSLWQRFRTAKLRSHSNRELRGAVKGKDNFVFGHIDVVSPEKFTMGDGCSFNHGCYVHAGNGVAFGNDVTVSANACVISTGIDYKAWAAGRKRHVSEGKVTIGDHVWIGANATVLPGASITGPYVIVAANAVVKGTFTQDHCILAGDPAKVVKTFEGNE